MVWTSPKTWVSTDTLPASELNTYLRDNLAELAPAKAVTPGSYFVTTDNGMLSERIPVADFIGAADQSLSNTYTDLDDIGPTVTVETSSQAWVFLYCHMFGDVNTAAVWMNYSVSGATTDDASGRDSTAIQVQAAGGQRMGVNILHTGLNPGMNTFTAKYRISTGVTLGTWSDRRLGVLPF